MSPKRHSRLQWCHQKDSRLQWCDQKDTADCNDVTKKTQQTAMMPQKGDIRLQWCHWKETADCSDVTRKTQQTAVMPQKRDSRLQWCHQNETADCSDVTKKTQQTAVMSPKRDSRLQWCHRKGRSSWPLNYPTYTIVTPGQRPAGEQRSPRSSIFSDHLLKRPLYISPPNPVPDHTSVKITFAGLLGWSESRCFTMQHNCMFQNRHFNAQRNCRYNTSKQAFQCTA